MEATKKSGLKIMAGQRTMSGLIGALTGQTLAGHIHSDPFKT